MTWWKRHSDRLEDEIQTHIDLETQENVEAGMSPEEAQCALELFRQLDNPMSRRCEGTGLGLPLAVQLTELHGGSFRIESVPGSGTSIFIRLPAGRAWEDGQPSTKTCVQPPPHPQAQDSRSGASQDLHDSGQDLKAKP